MLILGLVAIVVIGAIAMGKIRFFNSNIETPCSDKAGICMQDETECISSGGQPNFFFECAGEQVCCLGSCSQNGGTCVDAGAECSEGSVRNTFYFCDDDAVCCIGGV